MGPSIYLYLGNSLDIARCIRCRVSHLEGKPHSRDILLIGPDIPGYAELCFWLFVVNVGSRQRDWFSSLYFRTWIIGSSIAILYMPLVVLLTRSDPLKVPSRDSVIVETRILTSVHQSARHIRSLQAVWEVFP